MFVKLALFSLACVTVNVEASPIDDNVESIAPMFDAYRDVRILLSTRNNMGNAQQIQFRDATSIQRSHFDARRPTRVLVHGWWENADSDIKVETSAELLNYYDFNVIFIDWSVGARTTLYAEAAGRVPTMGTYVASLLDFMHENGFIQWDRVGMVGFSLGAHIAGIAGKNVRRGRINHIIGLDPAGPLFTVNNVAGRLDSGDANYVEVIHTNGQTLLVPGSGIGQPIGHADFWPNGGQWQTGCLTALCSHGRAVEFYVESIQNNAFFALGCPTRNTANAASCTLEPGAWMGGDAINFDKTLRGSFFLQTNNNAPFARGPNRP